MVYLLEISSKWHQCLNVKVVGSHYFGNLFKPGICSAHIFYSLETWKLDCLRSSLFLSLDAWNLLDCHVFFDHRRPQNRLHETNRHWLFTWEQICLWVKSSRREIFRVFLSMCYLLRKEETYAILYCLYWVCISISAKKHQEWKNFSLKGHVKVMGKGKESSDSVSKKSGRN